MDSLIVPKDLLAATAAVSCQVARSLDRSLFAEWKDFLEFFTETDLFIYTSLTKEIGQILGEKDIAYDSSQDPRPLPFHRFLWARVYYHVCGKARFKPEELKWISSSLRDGLQLVGALERPDQALLVDRRMRLSVCESLIGERISNGDMKMVRNVDHFNSALHLDCTPLHKIVAEKYLPKEGSRLS